MSGPAWCWLSPPPSAGVTPTTLTFGLEERVNSFSTDEENLGFRLAFQEANAAGPIHGRTITWKGYPRTGGDAAAEAVANATRLIDVDGVLALVNWGGPQSMTLLTLATERRVPYLFPHTALVNSAGQRYLFTSFPRFEGEAAVMFPYLARERKLTRLGIVHDVNAYGQLFLERLTALAAASGYTVAGTLPIDSRDPGDVAAGVKRLVDAGATAIVMALYPAQAKKVVEAKGALGWRGTLVSTGPLTDEQFLQGAGQPRQRRARLLLLPRPRRKPRAGRGRLPGGHGALPRRTSAQPLLALRLRLRPPGGRGPAAGRPRPHARAAGGRARVDPRLGRRRHHAARVVLRHRPSRAAGRLRVRARERPLQGAERLDYPIR